MHFPQQPSLPTYSLDDPRASSHFKNQSQAIKFNNYPEAHTPVSAFSTAVSTPTTVQSPALSSFSSTTAVEPILTPPSSISTPKPTAHTTAAPSYERILTYGTTRVPPTLRPMSPFQTSSAFSPPCTFATPVPHPNAVFPQQPPPLHASSICSSRPMFTNPLTGQHWYSDTPLLDQTQAPRFFALGCGSVTTPRLGINTSARTHYNPQQAPQHFVPGNSVTLSTNSIPRSVSVHHAHSPPPYEQHKSPLSFPPTAPPATYTDYAEEDETPLIFSPRQGWMTMQHRILLDEQMGETGW